MNMVDSLVTCYYPPSREVEYCDERCLFVYNSLHAYIRISQELHVQTFLCMLPMAVALTSSGSVAIRFLLRVL